MLIRDQRRQIAVEARFCGLPDIAHGGYVGGVLASALGAASAKVRLRMPVPAGRDLTLEEADGDGIRLRDGDAVLADATPAELDLELPAPVAAGEAEVASRRYPGHRHHLFPRCFGCGTERGDDGLRIFPGPVAGRKLVAAQWVPASSLADGLGPVPGELVWAALDCTQLWALIVHAPADRPDMVVTAQLETRLEHPVVAGEPHVVTAWPIGRVGRAWLAGAAVRGPDGELCAAGIQTAAIVTGWGVPLGRAHWGGEGSGTP